MSINKTKEIKYKEQFGVIVICESEEHQQRVFNNLRNQGLTLKIVTV